MDAKDLIAQGITLARRGQNEKAREMFNLALITDPRSENAWMWLSSVAMDDAEKEDCLRQVPPINPKNVSGQRAETGENVAMEHRCKAPSRRRLKPEKRGLAGVARLRDAAAVAAQPACQYGLSVPSR
jgi:hypothetical protein